MKHLAVSLGIRTFGDIALIRLALAFYQKILSGMTGNQDEAAGCKSLPNFDLSAWLTGGGPQIHFGVGCDYCGVRLIASFICIQLSYSCVVLSLYRNNSGEPTRGCWIISEYLVDLAA